ncbi:MAG: ATP-binding protein [Blastocatellales bacterium]|nr:ATP-binding protein [Blastocatellales bacterium]
MALKPWYTIATPREDLRECKPLDASEFAVHLDQVRDGRAPKVYQKPEEFFDRTYLTQTLTTLAAEVIRRLSGQITETSAVFNMTTQFGGGKTHSLTLLYHLAKHGPKSARWRGVRRLLDRAGIASVPKAATAVFVGTEFDSMTGRGGDDGTPQRLTPWGEIAYQLGGERAFKAVAKHDREMVAPAGDVIRKFLPSDQPCLILMDELMNYISRSRKSGLGTQLYNFVQNLSEEARGRKNVVLAVSIPASELEMSADDQADHTRIKKLLDRLGKAVIMSVETETSEIIRRRLFEWNLDSLTEEGRVMLDREATKTCREYAAWINDHRVQLPSWFPVDSAQKAIEASYPFHPTVLSVFERKWQALPRFQQTRGILRLLALWVSRAHHDGFKGAHRDPLIGLGTAPLDDPAFRTAVFEQLGESRLEGAVTTDICGKNDSFAVRLDKEAIEAVKKSRLHRKVATTIFFESNGGQMRTNASEGEIRLAVGEPDLDIGYVGNVLETLTEACYFLSVDGNRYRFSLTPNLNKLLSDRRASIKQADVADRVKGEIQTVFKAGTGFDRVYFPEKSNQVADRALLTLVVASPEHSFEDKKKTLAEIESIMRNCGTSARTFKNALIWAVPEGSSLLNDEARKLLAWEDIENEVESGAIGLDETQRGQLKTNVGRAKRDLREAIWRTYHHLVLLRKDNQLREVDLGLINSSAGEISTIILNRLSQDGDIVKSISPNFLVRNWPGVSVKEWSTRSVVNAIYASPVFPRLQDRESIKQTIATGVQEGIIAYVGIAEDGNYAPFVFRKSLSPAEVEISDEAFIIKKEVAEAYEARPKAPIPVNPPSGEEDSTEQTNGDGPSVTPPPPPLPLPPPPQDAKLLKWTGEVPKQKWSNFYQKVLTRFAVDYNVRLKVTVEINRNDGISQQKLEETQQALRELGLVDAIETDKSD